MMVSFIHEFEDLIQRDVQKEAIRLKRKWVFA